MPDVCVSLPPLDELARRWSDVERSLAPATARTGSYEPIDLLRLAMAGQWVIWTIALDGEIVAAAAGNIVTYPRNRVLQVPFIGGTGLRLWARPLLAELEECARKHGCAAIQGFDRKGWSRFGFEVTGVVLTRSL